MKNMKRNRPTYLCSFCGKNQDQVQRLIAGPHSVYICGECIDLFSQTSPEEQAAKNEKARKQQPRSIYQCSFCGKKEDQVERMNVGPGEVNICSECINLCQEIIEEESRQHPH